MKLKKLLYYNEQVKHRLWTKQQICNVKANFCNTFDSLDVPIFEDFIDYLVLTDQNRAKEWISILKFAGSTHITLALSGDYAENLGWAPRYPISGSDFTQDLSTFLEIIDWVVDNSGFIPIIKLAGDGQGYDRVGWTYGWQWLMDNMERIINGLDKYRTQALWSSGYDGCFPNWSPEQTIQYIQKLRSLVGEDGCIDTEFGNEYCHMGNGAADWSDDKLGGLDTFSVELVPAPNNLTQLDVNGPQQIAARLLGPAKRNIDPKNDGPYYLQNTTNKNITMCIFETVALPISRKWSTPQDAIDIANKIASYGFTSFGNGQPR